MQEVPIVAQHMTVLMTKWCVAVGMMVQGITSTHLKRIEEIYGAKGEEPNLKYYTEYMSAIAFLRL